MIHEGRIVETLTTEQMQSRYCEIVGVWEAVDNSTPNLDSAFGWIRKGDEWSGVVHAEVIDQKELIHVLPYFSWMPFRRGWHRLIFVLIILIAAYCLFCLVLVAPHTYPQWRTAINVFGFILSILFYASAVGATFWYEC